ncbi:MAG TPA: tetratricopeptide repeat protein [Pelomicrobium sp.]|nr:tetratricopeptide repeat protein [Pelomicrobium sp.]
MKPNPLYSALTAGAAALLLAAPAAASFDAGWRAYVSGDHATARTLLTAAADAGDARAAWTLGDMYARGRGVALEPSRALAWKERAAQLGDPAAQFIVGQMYARGNGAPKDLVKARSWLERAAARGHPNAQLALAELLVDKDGAASRKEATAWLERAAAAGLVEAKFALADELEFGPSGPPAAQRVEDLRASANRNIAEGNRIRERNRAEQFAYSSTGWGTQRWQPNVWIGYSSWPYASGWGYGVGFSNSPWGRGWW